MLRRIFRIDSMKSPIEITRYITMYRGRNECHIDSKYKISTLAALSIFSVVFFAIDKFISKN